jgi:dihydroflavonol-4-reductase
VQGTKHVVQACLGAGARRLVHVSSIGALVHTPLDRPVDEGNALVSSIGRYPYGYAKALAEREVRQGIAAGLDAVIVRPTVILGPYDFRVGSSNQLIVGAAAGQIPVALPGGCDFVDVRDVAAGALRAAEVAPCGADYMLGGEWATTLDVARRVAALTGATPPKGTLPIWAARGMALAGDLRAQLSGAKPQLTSAALAAVSGNRQISHARATRELGYSPRGLDATLADTVAWLQEQGVLPRQSATHTRVA